MIRVKKAILKYLRWLLTALLLPYLPICGWMDG